MKVWRLVIREIAHRKLSFLLGLLSVSAAVGCLVGAMTLLHGNEIRTGQLLEEKQQEVQALGAQLEDSMRKITKGLGFNILVLPQNQDLNELHVEGTLSEAMSETLVDKLANSRIVTINHLLPIVTKKMRWEEYDRTIILTGTRGEVPQAHRDPKKPLLDHVPTGTMVVGYQLQQQAGMNKGDEVELLGKKFKITETYPERGTADDSTVWVNLAEAQEMLGMQNLVNAILALECNCATKDRLAEIRADIAEILPGTQVIERGPPALARAEARNKAKAAAQASLEQETVGRANLEAQHEKFAAVLVPLVVIGSGMWIGFLALGNVRQRSSEIGILRAIGLKSTEILQIFLGKAVLMGLGGAVVGYLVGFGIGVAWSELPADTEAAKQLFVPSMVLLALVVAPLLSGLASWLPAMLAARQDPAVILQGD